MAILCWSNLDDGQGAAPTVDELSTSLARWVYGLLADAEIRSRSPRPFDRFAGASTDRNANAEGIALQTIGLIKYAQEQLLHRNAYLRYLCPDCPRGNEDSKCRRGQQPRAALKIPPTSSTEVAVAGTLVRSAARLSPMSKVIERLHLMASTIERSTGNEEDSPARARFVANLRRMAIQWRVRNLDDSAVDVEAADPLQFYGGAVLALSRARNIEEETTDARHSPVNFIAAVLQRLASHVSSSLNSVAREAVVAALVARNAAIEGDPAIVDEFARTWLGIAKPSRWREAVEAALLGDWVDELGRSFSRDAVVVALLKRHADLEHRFLRPLWERTVHGHNLTLLDAPLSEGLSLRDVIADRRNPENLVLGQLEDTRVQAVLKSLTPAERTAAGVYSSGRMTWTQAAEVAGALDPAAFGERVRRKLKRLGERQQARATSSARESTGPR